MSQQSIPLSPVLHSESSLTPVEEKRKAEALLSKQRGSSKKPAEAQDLRFTRPGMEFLDTAHTLRVLTTFPI